MTGVLLSTVVPAALLGVLTLALVPRTPKIPEHEWLPGELEAVRAMPDRPLTGTPLPPRRPLPPPRLLPPPAPALVVDADLGVLEIPPGRSAGTPIFDRMHTLYRLSTMTAAAVM